MILRALSLALALALGSTSAASARPMAPITIMISLDGFRADYLDRGVSPNLDALARDGVRAALQPSFPSMTFPNHFTLVTGVYPDRHGIVDNHFEDPGPPRRIWDLRDRAAWEDPEWWRGATPIWVTAEAQGLRTASMFWPTTGFDAQGRRPPLYQEFERGVTPQAISERALKWFDLPPERRPQLLLMYAWDVDHVGHEVGPDDPRLDQAIALVDRGVGVLVDGLKARGLWDQVNLVVVADHGMAQTSPKRVIVLDDLVDTSKLRTVTELAYAPLPGHEAELERALIGRHGHLTCWRKERLPARFHYGSNPRVPPIVCLDDVGWEVTTRAQLAKGAAAGRGDHGYDPAAPSMAALFVAHGPSFRRVVRGPKFPNVDVYPLLAHLLGITPRPNDGRLEDVKWALADKGS